MRRMFQVAGGTLSLVGVVWGLQGLGVLGGSPMTGESFWAWAGPACVIIGSTLLYFGLRRV